MKRCAKFTAVLTGIVLAATMIPVAAFGVNGPVGDEFVVTDEPGPDNQIEMWGDLVVWRHGPGGNVCRHDIFAQDLSTGVTFPVADDPNINENNPSVYGDIIVWSDEGDAISGIDLSTNKEFTVTEAEGPYSTCNPFVWGDWVVWVDGRNDTGDIYAYNLVTEEEKALVERPGRQKMPEMHGNRVIYYDENTSQVRVANVATGGDQLLFDGGASSPGIWGSKAVWTANGEAWLYDFTKGSASVISSDTVKSCIDIYENTVVYRDNRNCGSSSSLVLPTSADLPEGMCDSCAQDVLSGEADLMAGIDVNADSPMADIYGYDVATGEEFAVCTEMGCQKRPRVFGSTVVWMDNRSDTYPDIMGVYLDTHFTSVAGDDRFETACMASRKAFPGGADTVVIATGYNWPDALAAASLAGAVEGPVLICYPSRIPAVMAAEIERLGAKNAYIIGGPNAVSPSVEVDLNVMLTGTVERIAGSERCRTADLVAKKTVSLLGADYDGTSLVVTSLNYPDAIAAAPIAAAAKRPMFLAGPDGMMPQTKAMMTSLGVQDALLVGGPAAMPWSVQSELNSLLPGDVARVGGDSRYDTAANLARYGVNNDGLAWSELALATGLDFPDALTGGVLQGLTGSVVLLTPSYELHAAPKAKIVENKDEIADIKYLGGLNAVSQTVRDDVEAIFE